MGKKRSQVRALPPIGTLCAVYCNHQCHEAEESKGRHGLEAHNPLVEQKYHERREPDQPCCIELAETCVAPAEKTDHEDDVDDIEKNQYRPERIEHFRKSVDDPLMAQVYHTHTHDGDIDQGREYAYQRLVIRFYSHCGDLWWEGFGSPESGFR